jgi:Recombinase
VNAVLPQSRRRAGRPPRCSPEVARRILELKDQGYSLRRTAKQLNDEALPTPMGQAKWDKSHVWRVLGTLYMRELDTERAVATEIRTLAI